MQLKKTVCLCVLMIAMALAGCAQQASYICDVKSPCQKIPTAGYVQKTNSFLVLFDSSETMGDLYAGQKKLAIAKKLVCCMNATIPDMKFTAGLRSFGRGYKLFSLNATTLEYGMTDYSKPGLEGALAPITMPYGNTPLSHVISAAQEDLKAAPGQMALIIVSDGKATDEGTVAAAEKIKSVYGDKICIYTVLVGLDPAGMQTMKKVAAVSGCGFMTTADKISSAEGMADFVEKVFLAKKPAPMPQKIVLSSIMFDLDSAQIKPEYALILDEVAAILKKHTYKQVVIEGHTCSLASDDYNMDLSRRRAAATKEYLVGKGISASGLVTKGYGESRPVADNTIDAGRRQNRRVEFLVLQ